MAIEGPLEELSIQDVLQLLELARKTGVLTIRSDRLSDEAIVHFSRGAIVFAVRRRSTRRLGQLLIRAGHLTQRELDRALEIQHADPARRLAEILLEMGSVGEEELERQLRFQMEETIYELMAWVDGYFKFEERTEVAEQRLLARVRVDSLLMEGARRIDEWTRLESKVPGAEAVPVCLARLAPSSGWMKASINELNPDSPEVSFSIVTMSLPSASTASSRQELTSLLSMETVHAPHSPMLHPSLVFASRKSSTSTSRSVRHGSTAISRASPFTFIRTLYFVLAFMLTPSSAHARVRAITRSSPLPTSIATSFLLYPA